MQPDSGFAMQAIAFACLHHETKILQMGVVSPSQMFRKHASYDTMLRSCRTGFVLVPRNVV